MRQRYALTAIPATVALLASALLQAQDPADLDAINAIVTACERLEHDYAIYRDRERCRSLRQHFYRRR